jgi:serine/threonine protein kinase
MTGNGEILKKFGRYFLLDQIAQGGMAEIYRARMANLDGAGRLIVIKRIQAGYGTNAEFLSMFKSEIKVTMGFNHPNIVQLYDYGEEQQQPYIAMEFVDGRNLRQFMSRFIELKRPFPVELAAHIIEQAASGLHYAHTFKDKITGEPLNIVHRDISPQNVLISYEGTVKVIDFGIAKAAVNGEATRAGVIKGKPSYLSPEQIAGDILDGRCDIFALGIVLWELLCGRKLFSGDNDLAVLKLIESCQNYIKPPSSINRNVPPELDAIVLKALTKQREKRYQTAEELQRALHKFLYAFSPEFNPADLAYYAKDLFKEEIVEDRKRIQKLNDEVEQLLRATATGIKMPRRPDAGSAAAPPQGRGAAEDDDGTTDSTAVISSGSREYDVGKVRDVSSLDIDPSAAPRTRAAWSRRPGATRAGAPEQHSEFNDRPGNGKLIAMALAAGLVGVALFGPEIGINLPYVDSLFRGADQLVLQGDAKGIRVSVDGALVATALPAKLRDLPVNRPFMLSVSGPRGTFEQEITLKKGETKTYAVNFPPEEPRQAAPPPPASSTRMVSLHVNVTPRAGVALTVNGKRLDVDNPVVQVPADAPLEILARRDGYRTVSREFVISSAQLGARTDWTENLSLEAVRYGFLSVRSTPSADAIIVPVRGSDRSLALENFREKTPFEQRQLPVGTYNIKLVNEVLGMEKTVTVSIQEGKVVNLEERLEIKD